MEDTLGSASRSNVDPLSKNGRSEDDREHARRRLQGDARCPRWMYRGERYPGLSGLANEHDPDQGFPTG